MLLLWSLTKGLDVFFPLLHVVAPSSLWNISFKKDHLFNQSIAGVLQLCHLKDP